MAARRGRFGRVLPSAVLSRRVPGRVRGVGRPARPGGGCGRCAGPGRRAGPGSARRGSRGLSEPWFTGAAVRTAPRRLALSQGLRGRGGRARPSPTPPSRRAGRSSRRSRQAIAGNGAPSRHRCGGCWPKAVPRPAPRRSRRGPRRIAPAVRPRAVPPDRRDLWPVLQTCFRVLRPARFRVLQTHARSLVWRISIL